LVWRLHQLTLMQPIALLDSFVFCCWLLSITGYEEPLLYFHNMIINDWLVKPFINYSTLASFCYNGSLLFWDWKSILPFTSLTYFSFLEASAYWLYSLVLFSILESFRIKRCLSYLLFFVKWTIDFHPLSWFNLYSFCLLFDINPRFNFLSNLFSETHLLFFLSCSTLF